MLLHEGVEAYKVGRRCAPRAHKLGTRHTGSIQGQCRLVGATLGQTFNRNRAWLPLAHAITVGEHTAKVNSCWRATAAEGNASPGSCCFILLFGALDIDV